MSYGDYGFSCEIIQSVAHACPVQIAFSFLFGDDRFMKRYHREINGDPNAEVSRWSGDGRRHVAFVTPLNTPSALRKLVGEPGFSNFQEDCNPA